MDYSEFLARKAPRTQATGINVAGGINPKLFDWQAEIVRWALRRGRAAVFADTGMGKTIIQAEWAKHVHAFSGRDVLILAPLAVALQTVAEAAKFGIEIRYCRAQSDVQPGVTIANYDMLHAFDSDHFGGVVLDEASILKASDGKTRTAIIAAFAQTPYRLSCTATPAPNDHIELGNQAQFLGVMTQNEMLAMYFVHDGGSTQDWRLKGHAVGAFWRWVASWAVVLRRPSDIGHDDAGYNLPELRPVAHVVGDGSAWAQEQGYLLPPGALTLTQSRSARKASMGDRVAECAALVRDTPDQWLVWCHYNAEGDALTKAIPGAVQVAGSNSRDHKEQSMLAFAAGTIRVLVSKQSICGFGMNWQQCRQMAFVGIDYSYEGFYQAVRRCWRFGQQHPVDVHVFCGEAERSIWDALRAKEAAADAMAAGMLEHMRDTMRDNLQHGKAEQRPPYRPNVPMIIPEWLVEDAA